MRPTGIPVFDLSTPHGRTYYANLMAGVLNQATFDTTQWYCELQAKNKQREEDRRRNIRA